MAATDLSVTYSRSMVVDFAVPFSYDPIALLIPYPQLGSTISGIIKPFQPYVGHTRYIMLLNKVAFLCL